MCVRVCVSGREGALSLFAGNRTASRKTKTAPEQSRRHSHARQNLRQFLVSVELPPKKSAPDKRTGQTRGEQYFKCNLSGYSSSKTALSLALSSAARP